MSDLPYGNGNEFFYSAKIVYSDREDAEWVKPTNEIEVELDCITGPGIRNHLYIT